MIAGNHAMAVATAIACLYGSTEAVAACLTHTEARAAYGYGLRWTGDGKGSRCWGPAGRTGRRVAAAEPAYADAHKDAPGRREPIWLFGPPAPSREFQPLRLPLPDDGWIEERIEQRPVMEPEPPLQWQVVGKSAQNHASSNFPVTVTGLVIILTVFSLLWRLSYRWDKPVADWYAAPRAPARRIGGSRSRDRLSWLLLGRDQ
jgi:hypothetical protein